MAWHEAFPPSNHGPADAIRVPFDGMPPGFKIAYHDLWVLDARPEHCEVHRLPGIGAWCYVDGDAGVMLVVTMVENGGEWQCDEVAYMSDEVQRADLRFEDGRWVYRSP